MNSKPKRQNDQILEKKKKQSCDGCGKMPTKDEPNKATYVRYSGHNVESNLLSFCLLCSFDQYAKGWKKFLADKPFLSQKLAQMGWRLNGDGKLINY